MCDMNCLAARKTWINKVQFIGLYTQEKFNKPQKKCGRVRGKYGCINHEEQNDPVPHGFERTVVKDGPLLDPGSLQLIFWQHVIPQRQNLEQIKMASSPSMQTVEHR